jgi:pimeloyl-ACP methyl ester carboxylesterase
MSTSLLSLLLLWTPPVPAVDSKFVQVAPVSPRAQVGDIARSINQRRAVVLIEGLNLHLVNPQLATKPELRRWQQPGSPLVQTLAKDSDVFAFTYAQVASVSEIAEVPAFAESILRLRRSGYTEIVLVGFSAGGVIARQFVEDNPGAGVTKVVQVCTPNGGAALAKLKVGGAAQKPFLQSLTANARSQALTQRRDKRIPADLQFVCVVGNGLITGDGVVSTRSQWTEDLQTQGIPASIIDTEHWKAVAGDREAQIIARLVRDNQPRWDAGQVSAMRRRLWHESSK